MNKRLDFPIFDTHPDLIYLDSAATSQKPKIVLDAVEEYYKSYNANIHRGIYPIAEKATDAVEQVRKKVARFINAAHDKEIIFTNGTTHAINSVMYSWGDEYVKASDTIVTTIAEHHANFVPWQELAHRKNATFVVLDIDNEADVLFPDESILKKASIVALSHVSNVTGRIYDVKNIIQRIRRINKDCVVLIDAAQAVPFTSIDVQELDCDFLVFSGHKLFAETGVGVLYGKKERLEKMRPFLFGGSMIQEVSVKKTTYAQIPNKFEAGTLNISGIISLGAAIDYVNAIGMKTIQKREQALISEYLQKLENIEGLRTLGPKDPVHRAGIVSFTMDGIHPHDIAQVLGDNNICVRAGHHCTMPLHTKLGLPASVRVSVSMYNTEEEVTALIKTLHNIRDLFATSS